MKCMINMNQRTMKSRLIMVALCTALCAQYSSSLSSIEPVPGQRATSNQVDKSGRRHGLWIEEDKERRYARFYNSGTLNGLYTEHMLRDRKPQCIGHFENGIARGQWVYFRGDGSLEYIVFIARENSKKRIRNAARKWIIPRYSCWLQLYRMNGTVVKEGEAVYDESVEVDYYMVGKWRYFDENGDVVREEDYSSGRLSEDEKEQ